MKNVCTDFLVSLTSKETNKQQKTEKWEKKFLNRDFPGGTIGKEPTGQCRRDKTQVQSLSWEDPLEEEMALHSSSCLEKSHGQRSLAGHSLQGLKESDRTDHPKHIQAYTFEDFMGNSYCIWHTPEMWNGDYNLSLRRKDKNYSQGPGDISTIAWK